MTISGYTFVRNAVKLAYPLKESILSILDIVDEFVIAYCPEDEDDNTLEVIESINSKKSVLFRLPRSLNNSIKIHYILICQI